MRNSQWSLALAANVCTAFLIVAPANAQPGGPGWRGMPPGPPMADGRDLTRPNRDRSREGRIQVSTFVADGNTTDQLGHGAIVLASQSGAGDHVAESDRAVFEAAVIDQLVKSGYDTTQPKPQGGQSAELRIAQTVIEPAETRRKPVSGQAAMEVSNRGTAYGLAVNVDLTKPLPPLVSTRLEARIVDRESGKVLWEGRAQVATREGDEDWTGQDIASRLAEALFDGFPRATDAGPLPG